MRAVYRRNGAAFAPMFEALHGPFAKDKRPYKEHAACFASDDGFFGGA